jgi:ferrochelatase
MPEDQVQPYDALLLLSFGGPEGRDDVMPFLENVTRGRGVPAERLAEVAEHYYRFGGVSPINALNRDLLAGISDDLAAHGIDLPVYWGNRNWKPYLADTLREMRDAGVRRCAAFVTSAYASYSSCRQYLDDIESARGAVAGAPEVDKLRLYYDHPGFIEPIVDAVRAALGSLNDDVRDDAHLAFVAHSIPEAMNAASGPSDYGVRGPMGGAYVAQLNEVARLVVERLRQPHEEPRPWRLVYCSRSGSPHTPWLEPDIGDYLEQLRAAGVPSVVIVPIGFVSDHLEVVYDLDIEALDRARELGLPAVRAATAGTDKRFVSMIRELLLERIEGAPEARLGAPALAAGTCTPGCCQGGGRPT